MKKLLLPILLFMLFIPFYVNAETCDTDKISISSITVESKSDSVEELDEATASGKNINLNLSMLEVGDNIEYKVVVKNDSNEDYELDKNSFNISSDYINYSIESDDDSNVVKAKSSKNVTLRVEYKNEVPKDKFKSESYNDNKTMRVQLSNENIINVPDTFKNPNTGVQSHILIILILLLISGSLYVFLKKKKYTKFMILIFGTAIIIPISVYAACKSQLQIESNVIIRENEFDIFTLDNTNVGDDFSNEINYYRNYNDVPETPSLFHHVYNNKITTASIAIPYGESYVLLNGGGATYNATLNKYENDSKFYNENKNVINKTFENNSNVRCNEDEDRYYCIDCARNVYQECRLMRFMGEVHKDGYVSYQIYNYFCQIEANGTSSCSEIYD